MLKKSNRLNKSKDIKEVLKTGKAFYSPSLVLRIKKTPLAVSRFAFIISTKISKKAVKRNLARRRIAEQIRLLLPQIKTGYDCVILATPKLITAEGKVSTAKILKQNIVDLFKKSRIL